MCEKKKKILDDLARAEFVLQLLKDLPETPGYEQQLSQAISKQEEIIKGYRGRI